MDHDANAAQHDAIGCTEPTIAGGTQEFDTVDLETLSSSKIEPFDAHGIGGQDRPICQRFREGQHEPKQAVVDLRHFS